MPYKHACILPSSLPSGHSRRYECITFEYVRDAEEAMYGLDRNRFLGRELDIQFAEGDRKTPNQMRSRDTYKRRRRTYSRSPDYDRRSRSRSPSRRSRSRSPYRRSRSRSPYRSRRSRSRTRSRSYSQDKNRRRRRRRSFSRSRSRSHSRSRSR
ncbi:serine/arginine-rich splicing factor 10-like isoform X2 [Patiria miniata]|uniref:Uncharacterized protein n=1 Tax=Patiria miniata TaxID=46514 RepID=A0A914AMJ6_PATMI|nr:serine/arginine-rich splicing factor 10-like isoform X2 [Patiria miniata]